MELLVFALLVIALVLLVGRSRAKDEAAKARAAAANAEQSASSSREDAARARLELEGYKAREAEIGTQLDRATKAAAELDQLQRAIVLADSLLEDREPVIYPRRFPEETSAALKERMTVVRDRQAEIRRKGQVVIRFGTATQERLPPVERAKLKSLVRLARLALEGASDTLLDQVKATNQDRLDTRFRALVEDMNRLLQPWGFEIGKNYQATVRESLELMAEYVQQLDREREEQRALREQMREEAAAQREIDRAQREAEESERRAARELEKAQQAAAKATEEERERWLLKVQELEQALSAAHENKERAVAMAQLTKAGHVYIISNIGAFGETVFKVGMTRRLDPNDRIAELGDASVPFPFDIHGLIKSDNAPALEATLHAALEAHRVNLVNERKEFFRVPFAVLRDAVTATGATVELTEVAQALEFRQSESLRKGLSVPVFDVAPEVGAEDLDEIEEKPGAVLDRSAGLTVQAAPGATKTSIVDGARS